MFSRFPLHIEQAGLRSRPWVTNAILGLCALAFAATWLVPDDPIGVPASDIAVVVTHWADNPGTTLRPEFIDRFVSRGALQRATRTRAALEQDPRRERKDRAEAQALLDEQSQRALTMQDESPLYRHALVPSRADRPVAWLAHLFLHLGWLHLLVNLFLVFLVAPTLEDVWGRRLFSAFYVLAGLAAAAVQVLSDRAWTGMILGASGAIAGCMGALACLWVQRRVRTLGVRLWAGTLVVPAWPAGVLWLLAGLWSAWSLAGGVMAVIAHLAGFCFGALAAFALTRLGLGAEELGGPRRSQAGGAGFFAATPPRGSGLYDSPGYAGPRFLTQPQPPASSPPASLDAYGASSRPSHEPISLDTPAPTGPAPAAPAPTGLAPAASAPKPRPEPAGPVVKSQPCAILAYEPTGLRVKLATEERELAWSSVLAFGGGVVSMSDGVDKKAALLTDLIVQGPTTELILRITGAGHSLDKLTPGAQPKIAYLRFIEELKRQGARFLGDEAQVAKGELQRFSSIKSYERALHGPTLPR